MICGTTPTHTFEVPFAKDEMSEAWVMYAQGCDVLLTKKTESLKIEDNLISCDLSQEDTLLFNPHRQVDIQLKIKLKDGKVVASNIATISAMKILDCDVI